ncbi:hypothetical protein COO60DRAFT_841763 [Scenedesmus sp. NREL 46B-D3]|nr:hypothetical protein COO60DRAFT_841763 [Scenedesmus sp. NREL 46B-D3]
MTVCLLLLLQPCLNLMYVCMLYEGAVPTIVYHKCVSTLPQLASKLFLAVSPLPGGPPHMSSCKQLYLQAVCLFIKGVCSHYHTYACDWRLRQLYELERSETLWLFATSGGQKRCSHAVQHSPGLLSTLPLLLLLQLLP